MTLLSEVRMYARFARGLPGFFRRTISLHEAQAGVRQRLAEREANFLRMVERGIFGHPRSPYLPLLRLARVERGDIRRMVRERGLEDTLRALRKSGVYVTFEEFKGRKPIVRDGQVIPVQARSFDNPYLQHYYYAGSGGTTGVGTRVPIDVDHLSSQAVNFMLSLHAHRILNAPTVMWRGILPDTSSLGYVLRVAKFGCRIQQWYTPVVARNWRPGLKNRLATWLITVASWLSGHPIPWPKPVRLEEAEVLARWAVETLERSPQCVISTHVSKAVRVAIAAHSKGLDLTGTTFEGGGEPPTAAKVREITRTGARHVPHYFFAEAGQVGAGCAQPADTNDIHFFKDLLALIQHPRQIPGTSTTVDAFLFTTLLPSAPKLLLNVESDDYGVIERRSCGCPLESYGYTDHLRHIRSFRKLTGEGVTLVGSEMVHILEEVLPSHFGGSPLDYQLLEEEDKQGFTRLSLLISPRVNIDDERVVIEAVLEALEQSSVAANLARAIWAEARTLRVKRMEPVWTAQGKLMPLHLAQSVELLGGASNERSG
jgi:hypothetical protein